MSTLLKNKPASSKNVPHPPTVEKTVDGKVTLDEALDLLQGGDPAKAKFLLEQLKAAGYKPRYVDLDDLIRQAEPKIQQAERRRLAQLEYEELCVLAARKMTHIKAVVGFSQWRQEFPVIWRQIDSAGENLRKRFSSFGLMPKPFDWITIPAGNITLTGGGYIPEEGQTFGVPAFTIAKYPLTNAQFSKFIEADGYAERRWWTEEGWSVRESQGWTEPRFWQENAWNQPDHPVVGVSWFETVAFCLWLSEMTSENIMLPTEQQWQRAAQGDSNWAYPWGPEFTEMRCNFNIEGTIPVNQYEGKGDSPFKVVDMSGNTWEWCLTDYDNGWNDLNKSDVRVRRGGSWWSLDDGWLCCDFRDWSVPSDGYDNVGFRLARS